jgi:hypothetical protein
LGHFGDSVVNVIVVAQEHQYKLFVTPISDRINNLDKAGASFCSNTAVERDFVKVVSFSSLHHYFAVSVSQQHREHAQGPY